MHDPIIFFDLLGVVFFAIAGALSTGRKRMDLFGVAVVGCVTAIGGGTLRDVLLGSCPEFWPATPPKALTMYTTWFQRLEGVDSASDTVIRIKARYSS